MLLLPTTALSATEAAHVRTWCASGSVEHVLPDRTRVDCLTDEYAIEFDWAAKWAEGAGQAIYYGTATGRKPAVVLIVRSLNDIRHVNRLLAVAERTGLRVWLMEALGE